MPTISPTGLETLSINEVAAKGGTMKVMRYPEDFYHFGKGANVEQEGIGEFVNESLEHLKGLKEGTYCTMQAGNTLAIVFRHEARCRVIVCKDYDEAYVDMPTQMPNTGDGCLKNLREDD